MNREALVVGINYYPFLKDSKKRPQHLRKPADDAEAIAQLLEKHGGFRVRRFPEKEVCGVRRVNLEHPKDSTTEIAKAAQLQEEITRLFNPPSKTPPDTALLFFAGHGLRNDRKETPEYFLAASDANANPENGKWGISLDWLHQILQKSPVRQQVVWLDCCHSGALLNFEEANSAAEVQRRDRSFITASRDFEQAYEEADAKNSIFTSALLQGLDPEQQSKGYTTSYKLKDFIDEKLVLDFPRQRPLSRNYGREIVLTGKKEKIDRAVLMAQICPYKGLVSFDSNKEDPKYFHGRRALTEELLEKIGASNFLAVVGVSGSGKSSVVQAGLLHELKLGQRIPGSDTWELRTFRPGYSPICNLAETFVKTKFPKRKKRKELKKIETAIRKKGQEGLQGLINGIDANRLVLVIDEFEEVFTLCTNEEKRQSFFECLLGVLAADVAADGKADVTDVAADGKADVAADVAADGKADVAADVAADGVAADKWSGCKLTVVITMRADFLDKCAEGEYAGLSKLIQENIVRIAPMNREELTEAIVKPAEQVDLEIEPELVTQMLADFSEPGSLPLLQYTLWDLWQNRQVNRLTVTEYTRLGGVKEALQKRADEVYQDLSEEGQQTAKRIFLELTQLGEGTEDTRRQVTKSQLVTPQQPEAIVDKVIEKLADERLLVISQEEGRSNSVIKIDVAHEALIRHWPQLHQWINDNREAIRKKRSIEADYEKWIDKKKAKEYLLAGVELAEAEKFIENCNDIVSISTEVENFIKSSIEKRRQNRLLLMGGASILVAIFTATTAIPTSLWLQTKKFAAIATIRGRSLVLKNLLPAEPVEALAMAIQITGKSQDLLKKVLPQVRSSLYDAVAIARERNLLKGHNSNVLSVAISPDGQTIVSGSFDGNVRLWDLEGNQIGQPLQGHKGIVYAVAISPDGKTIVSGGADKTVRLWDLEGNIIGELQGHESDIYSVAISPDGKTIVSGSADKTVRIWDLQGNIIGEPFKGHKYPIWSVAVSPDGKRIVSGSADQTVRLWDLQGNAIGKPFQGHEGAVYSIAISADGKTIVSGSADQTVRIWDLEGNAIGEPLQGHRHTINSVAFSPIGKTIVSGSSDKTMRLWSLEGKPIGEPLRGHEGWVFSVAISQDGKTIVSGGDDKTVRLWDRNYNAISSPLQKRITSVAISQDGKTIVSGSEDETVRLWERSGKPIGHSLQGHEGHVTSVAISSNAQTIVSGSNDKTVRLWNLDGNQIGEPLEGHEDAIASVAISPDGKTIVSGSKDKTVRLWNLDGNQIGEPFQGHQDWVRSVAISSDGQTIVSGSNDKTVRIWDLEGNQIGDPLQGHEDRVTSVAISSDGQTIVSGSNDKTVRLWDLKGNQIGEPLQGHQDWVRSVAISPDGKIVISGSEDERVRLWDRNGNPIGDPLQGHEGYVTSVAISPNGKTIISGSLDGTVRLWRGGSWRDLLSVACNRLQNHPVLVEAESEMAAEAVATCRKYVWEE